MLDHDPALRAGVVDVARLRHRLDADAAAADATRPRGRGGRRTAMRCSDPIRASELELGLATVAVLITRPRRIRVDAHPAR